MSNLSANTHLAKAGSPFSPGIPLKAHQPIFGLEEVLRFIAGELLRFKSVNLIGERRMGKTSLLNHLLGNKDRLFNPSASHPQLMLVHVDLQENISKAEQFYGKALRGLLETLPRQSSPQAEALESWRARLQKSPEATGTPGIRPTPWANPQDGRKSDIKRSSNSTASSILRTCRWPRQAGSCIA